MARQSKLTALGQAASNLTGAAFRLVRRAVSSLGVWILPIVVAALTAAALTGRLSLHRGAGPEGESDQAVTLGEQPFMVVDLYYSRDYIKVVKTAHQEGHDVLASFRTLESAWNEASPAAPLAIKLVSPSLPEPITGKSASPILVGTAVMDESSFREVRPLLEDLRSLILEGDGSGCGRLHQSGYEAQPCDMDKAVRAGSRDTKASIINVGPAKFAPRPAETL